MLNGIDWNEIMILIWILVHWSYSYNDCNKMGILFNNTIIVLSIWKTICPLCAWGDINVIVENIDSLISRGVILLAYSSIHTHYFLQQMFHALKWYLLITLTDNQIIKVRKIYVMQIIVYLIIIKIGTIHIWIWWSKSDKWTKTQT